MSSIVTYEELLPCGGKFKISQVSWEISYYISGIDLRYNGTINESIQIFEESKEFSRGC